MILKYSLLEDAREPAHYEDRPVKEKNLAFVIPFGCKLYYWVDEGNFLL